ncbi:UDP-N-acetylglucosamine--N-acetylmuramyl-(pentapeptide) pyrophosphoryl-undecaprenol N-acetylglucosamine transferase, partial [Nodularia sp. UHCC 0506]|nr:UDP-N-acetylglucosamine--N-acetylmuramyl-(pentapeptide) pyrophosphoryl-undecaprenol N-acetylglucosamine transferase [Nodularia sp. UHCC 0506]
SELTTDILQTQVLNLLQSPTELAKMAENAKAIAVPDSAEKLASVVREIVEIFQ